MFKVETHPVVRFFYCLAVLLSTAALISGVALGQAVSQISGTIHDSTGAVVPDVQVTATQTDTGVKRTATTDAAGYYILPNLPLGPYRVEATKMGFQTYVQTGIVLQVGTAPEIPIALAVGQVTQAVQVEANVSQVETQTSGIGAVVETQRILDLPLNGRDPTQLITVIGAAVQGAANPSYDMRTGYQFSVAGGYGTGVQYNWDGANYVSQFTGVGMLLPFPDALQEFKVSTGAQDASNVGQGAASVNAVTKSGTNAFHGDLFEFIRNYDVNARDFFAPAKDGLKRNQFGGTFGGPIKKDKLFFFLGYQETRVRQTPFGTQEFVPTPAELVGDFTAWASPQCQNGQHLTLRGPGFANNMISPSLFSPAAVAIAKRLPAGSGPCGTITQTIPLHENDLQAPARLDYQLSDKQTLFARIMIARQDAVVPYTLEPNNVLAADGVGNDMQETTFTLGDTYLVSPNVVNSTRLFFNRIAANLPGAKMFGPQDVGINMYTYQPNYLPVRVVGAFTIGGGQFSQDSFAYTTSFGLNEDFSISHGSHLFRFGGYFMHTNEWSVAQAWSAGSFTFAPALTGSGLSDFFLGFASQFREANPNPVNARENSMALYANDTWKLTPKLTLNYGIVWDPFFGISFPQNDSYTFNLGNFYKGIRSTEIPNAPPGFLYPGDPGFSGTSPINSKYNYVDPRVGLAWDPFGDGKTAVRVGAGISHDLVPLDLQLNTESSSPFRLTEIPTGIFNGLSNPFPGGNPFPYNYNKSNPFFAPYGSYLPIPANLQAHTLYSWNMGVQRQMTQGWFLSATYIGHHYIHTWDSVELNPAEYIPGNCAGGQYGLSAPGACTSSSNINQRRALNLANPSAQLGYLTMYDDGGTQGYNGLLLTTTWRLKNNLTLNANYTWSHCIGLPDVGVVLNPGQNYFHQGFGQNTGPADRNLDYGNCALDRRQVANVTLVYQTPRFNNGFVGRLASDWTVSTLITASTGPYFSVYTGTTPDPSTGFGGNPPGDQRPHQLSANTASPNRGQACPGIPYCVQWLNPAVFAAPAVGTFGNLAPYSLLGPAFWQWDQSIARSFRIKENQTFQIRAEAYNVTNSVRLGLGYSNSAGTTAGTSFGSTFGAATSDATPDGPTSAPARVMQFALKYVF